MSLAAESPLPLEKGPHRPPNGGFCTRGSRMFEGKPSGKGLIHQGTFSGTNLVAGHMSTIASEDKGANI